MDKIENNLKHNIDEKENNCLLQDNDKKINELKLKLENAQKNINDIKLRQLAEIENIEKKTRYQIEQEKKIEKEIFFKKTLSIIDHFEETLLLSQKLKLQDEPVIKGVELTLKSFLSTMCKFGISIEGQEHEIFNPNLHNATSEKVSTKIKHNHIISVHKKGYTFNKTVLRKSIVTIAKNKSI
ncbi:nucleotide exchange factor GrpE [Buchnera aphidicola]|uniref:nucleotide exchange factor GrpE n=1 Tax=Buchnera aphidicola TaxID=9 RepID=UPI0034642937